MFSLTFDVNEITYMISTISGVNKAYGDIGGPRSANDARTKQIAQSETAIEWPAPQPLGCALCPATTHWVRVGLCSLTPEARIRLCGVTLPLMQHSFFLNEVKGLRVILPCIYKYPKPIFESFYEVFGVLKRG